MRHETSRINSGLLSLNGETNEMMKKLLPFDITQCRVLKDIADNRFEALRIRVQR